MANWLTEQLLSINVVNEKFNRHEEERKWKDQKIKKLKDHILEMFL